MPNDRRLGYLDSEILGGLSNGDPASALLTQTMRESALYLAHDQPAHVLHLIGQENEPVSEESPNTIRVLGSDHWIAISPVTPVRKKPGMTVAVFRMRGVVENVAPFEVFVSTNRRPYHPNASGHALLTTGNNVETFNVLLDESERETLQVFARGGITDVLLDDPPQMATGEVYLDQTTERMVRATGITAPNWSVGLVPKHYIRFAKSPGSHPITFIQDIAGDVIQQLHFRPPTAVRFERSNFAIYELGELYVQSLAGYLLPEALIP